MNETFEGLTTASVESQEQAIELIEKLYGVARPGAVFSQPMEIEGRTVITAAEVNVGLGIGFGFGGGSTPGEEDRPKKGHRSRHAKSSDPHERVTLTGGAEGGEGDPVEAGAEEQEVGLDVGMGGGGGGGGGASGRPIAVISVTEEGVEVEPVVDVTKIALAFFTALGSMFFMLTKMKKAADR
jgi:uncharacterized spore protein YtfJ